MLTPYFELRQTSKTLEIRIKAPMANVAKTELSVDGDTVIFYSSPYYLRLHLPGNVREDEKVSSGTYDADRGEFWFVLIKEKEGEEFKDLDLLGRLLEPRKKGPVKPLIEVIDDEGEQEDDDSDWYIEQELVDEDTLLPSGVKYGFANKTEYSGRELRDEFKEIIDIRDVDKVLVHERGERREEVESAAFSEDHYFADFMDPGEIEQILKYTPTWYGAKDVELTKEEKDTLKSLGNREYLLDRQEEKAALLSLVDILFGYAYDHRVFFGEKSVESAWNINKLSATLSWFQVYNNMKEAKRACVRRSLIYPLFRNWKLSERVLKDTLTILRLGRRQILKCLLEIHGLFNESEPRYLLNQLYIVDYCIWLQKVSEKKIQRLAEVFSECSLSKEDVGLELELLEMVAQDVEEEEVTQKIKGVALDTDSDDD